MEQYEVENAPYIDIIYCIPENFFHKSVNEPFIQWIMSTVLEKEEWKAGNPDQFEPDYFCSGIPFEFTIASDQKRKNNFVQRYQRGMYTSSNIDDDIFGYIKTALEKKAKKNYSVPDVNLCILCMIETTSWVLDEYGSVTYDLIDQQRKEFFEEMKQQYIDTGIFQKIFIIFPDMTAKWWVWDVLTNQRANIQLSPSVLDNHKQPYTIAKGIYDTWVKMKKRDF